VRHGTERALSTDSPALQYAHVPSPTVPTWDAPSTVHLHQADREAQTGVTVAATGDTAVTCLIRHNAASRPRPATKQANEQRARADSSPAADAVQVAIVRDISALNKIARPARAGRPGALDELALHRVDQERGKGRSMSSSVSTRQRSRRATSSPLRRRTWAPCS